MKAFWLLCQAREHLIRSPLPREYLDDYAGLFDMSKGVAVNFRQAPRVSG